MFDKRKFFFLIAFSVILIQVFLFTSCIFSSSAVARSNGTEIENNSERADLLTASLDTSTWFGVQRVLDEDSLLVSLSRGYCFGTCPVYSVHIYSSGLALYVGQANVDMEGRFSGHVSADQLAGITRVAKEIDYFSMDTLYNNPPVSDLPSHSTSVVWQGWRKSIKRRIGFPESLLRLEKEIDRCVAEVSWHKIE